MNIGTFSSTPISAVFADVKPAELATVGRTSSGAEALSNRPVPELDDSANPSFVKNNPNRLPGADQSSLSAQSDAAFNEEQSAKDKQQKAQEQQTLEQEQREIAQLSARDREVRAHEQAHAAVGGQYAGAPQYQFERGPDGVNYAVGGEVSIDVSRAGTPQETIQKMQVVKRAALAPAEPSAQDRRVASQAARLEAEARKALVVESHENSESGSSQNEDSVSEQKDSTNNSSSLGDESSLQRDARFSAVGALSPSAISSQLNRSIEAAQLSSRRGSLLDQLA